MLASGDSELAGRDNDLPGLPVLLDRAALGALLADYLDRPGSLRVDYLRYKPGTSLTAGLELATPAGVVRAFAVTGSQGFAAKLDKVTGTGRHGLHPPLAVDPTRHVVVAVMENDRRLPALHNGLRGVRHTLPGALADGQIGVERYRPMRRVVAVVESEGAPAAMVRVVDPSKVDAHLQRSQAVRRTGIAVAAELSHHRRRGVLVSEYVHGSVSDDGVGDVACQEIAGSLLAQLHRGDLPTRLPDHDLADALHAAARLVSVLVPDRAGMVTEIARALTSRLAPHERDGPLLVHGDFSVDQLVRTGTEAVLLDLDRVRAGAPEWDVATWFAAEVLADRAAAYADPEDLLAPLLAAYRHGGGRDLRENLRGYAAAALLLRTAEPFRLRLPGWPQRTCDLLDAATRLTAVSA